MRAHVTQGQQAFPQLIRTRKNGGEKLPRAAKLALRAARRASGIPGGEGSPLGQRPWALALLQWVCNSGRLSPTLTGPCPRGVRGLIFRGQPRTRGLLLRVGRPSGWCGWSWMLVAGRPLWLGLAIRHIPLAPEFQTPALRWFFRQTSGLLLGWPKNLVKWVDLDSCISGWIPGSRSL